MIQIGGTPLDSMVIHAYCLETRTHTLDNGTLSNTRVQLVLDPEALDAALGPTCPADISVPDLAGFLLGNKLSCDRGWEARTIGVYSQHAHFDLRKIWADSETRLLFPESGVFDCLPSVLISAREPVVNVLDCLELDRSRSFYHSEVWQTGPDYKQTLIHDSREPVPFYELSGHPAEEISNPHIRICSDGLPATTHLSAPVIIQPEKLRLSFNYWATFNPVARETLVEDVRAIFGVRGDSDRHAVLKTRDVPSGYIKAIVTCKTPEAFNTLVWGFGLEHQARKQGNWPVRLMGREGKNQQPHMAL